jgi:hypothetical protein
MNWKGYGRKWMGPNLRYYPEISPEVLRKPSKNLSQDSGSSGRDLNPESPECEPRILPTWLQHLAMNVYSSWENPKSEDGLWFTIFVCYFWETVYRLMTCRMGRKKAGDDNSMKAYIPNGKTSNWILKGGFPSLKLKLCDDSIHVLVPCVVK